MQVGDWCMWTKPQPPKGVRIVDGPVGWAYQLGGAAKLWLSMHWQWEVQLPTGKTKTVPQAELEPIEDPDGERDMAMKKLPECDYLYEGPLPGTVIVAVPAEAVFDFRPPPKKFIVTKENLTQKWDDIRCSMPRFANASGMEGQVKRELEEWAYSP